MEDLEDTITSKVGFFQHVFNFDNDSKGDIMNIIQYSLLAIIPIVLLNKLSQKYIPDVEEEKGSVEILAEIIIQVLVIFLGMLLIHRILVYIPTYSEKKYTQMSITSIVLPVLLITLSLQTKLGEKVAILFDRVSDLWNGTSSKDKKKQKPKPRGSMMPPPPPPMTQPGNVIHDAIAQSLYSGGGGGGSSGVTSLSQLPNPDSSQQSSPDYNNMYQSSLPGASNPGMIQEGFVPMAANEGVGSAFGSSFGSGF